jgi:hypothetical protein
MKLYITDTSPYARIARVVILEKGLENRIAIIYALTRLADSPYYRINGGSLPDKSINAAGGCQCVKLLL